MGKTGGKSGMVSVRCPHCGSAPGNEMAMLMFPGHGPWTCVECGDSFGMPKIVPLKQLERQEDSKEDQ